MTRGDKVAVLVALIGLLVGVVVLLAQPGILGGLLGDPAKEVLTIDNRSDEALLVYVKLSDGSEQRLDQLIPPIPPQTSLETDAPCTGEVSALVARDHAGELVADRPQSDECIWVIEPDQG